MRSIGLIGMIFWTGIVAVLSQSVAVTNTEMVCGVEEERHSYLFALFSVLPIILWAGFRTERGYVNTNAYIRFYSTIPNTFGEVIQYIRNVNDSDWGFTLLTWLIKQVFGASYTPYLFIIALVQCTIVAFFFRKYSSNYSMSFFLFVASAEYFSWIFNGMRQFLAVVITLTAFKYLLDKQYIKYVLIVLIASTIHMTAIIMLPLAFVVQGKPWNKKTLLIIALALFAIVYTSQFTHLIDASVQNTQYSESISSWEDNGSNPIRVLFYSIPTVFSLLAINKIESDDNAVINVCVNMSIVSSALWLISMVTSGIYIGRLPIYVGLYNYVLYPYLIENYFDDITNAQIAEFLMIVVYLVYYYYQIHIAWNAI